MGKERQKSPNDEGIKKTHHQNETGTIHKDKCANNSLRDQENLDRQPKHYKENMVHVENMKLKQKKALMEFRCRVEDAILGNYLLGKPNNNLPPIEVAKAKEKLKEITLWGVPLLPSKRHEGTDFVPLKFLKARDFKVHEAFKMLQKTLKWRREFKADGILEEKILDSNLEKVVYMTGKDKEGHPLYFNVYGALRDRELYQQIFGTPENFERFLRWRVQFMEKGIEELNFKAGGADSIVQISDFKNSSREGLKRIRLVSKKTSGMIQDNYPELLHRNIIINVPFWYYLCHWLISKLRRQKTAPKCVFVRPSDVTKTLLKFIAPENLPIEYGGLQRPNDDEFFPEDKVSELIIRKNSSGQIQIPVSEAGVTIVWDLTVVGWNVSYKEEFIPEDEGSYTVLLQKEKDKKMGESIRNSFYISEPGKLVITIHNSTFKKKKVFYRSKAKPTVPMYIFLKK